MLILDHCDAQLSLEHGTKLGSDWHCANKTQISPGQECSTFLNTCHTLLDLTGPLQLGALPGAENMEGKPLDGCIRNLLRLQQRNFDTVSRATGVLYVSPLPEQQSVH